MAAETWTEEQLGHWLEHQGEDDPAWLTSAQGLAERWLSRGDGVAVYENHDMGHPQLGMGRMASFGSSAAQFESAEPPWQFPDFPGEINWRYVLIATVRREAP